MVNYLAIKIRNILVVNSSASAGFAPQTRQRGSAPGLRWGTSVPRPPLICSPTGTNF